MSIFSFKFGYYKFDNKKWALNFSSKCKCYKFSPKKLMHILKPTYESYIFWHLMFEVGVIENSIRKYNTRIWKMPLKIQENILTNAYLPTQIRLLHVWSKKLALILSPKWRYCKFGPKIECIFCDPYGNIVVLATFHNLVSPYYSHILKWM